MRRFVLALPDGEAVAISCGRGGDSTSGKQSVSSFGQALAEIDPHEYEWVSDPWVVRWKGPSNAFGIVARSTNERGADARTPEAILEAFGAFLEYAQAQDIRAVHVTLLGAGEMHVFAPWVSLVQMARAYGDWSRKDQTVEKTVAAYVYLVDRQVLALMQGGFLDITQALHGGEFGINVDTYDAGGLCVRHHELIRGDDCIGSLMDLRTQAQRAQVHVLPNPRRDARPVSCAQVQHLTFRNFGVVPGSTLVIDFRDIATCEPRAASGT